MALSVSEIRAMTNSVFDALEASGTTQLVETSGYYRSIDCMDAWDMTQEPAITVGDLADDFGDFRSDRTTHKDEMPLIVWHTLEHLLGVLIALSHEHKARIGLGREGVI